MAGGGGVSMVTRAGGRGLRQRRHAGARRSGCHSNAPAWPRPLRRAAVVTCPAQCSRRRRSVFGSPRRPRGDRRDFGLVSCLPPRRRHVHRHELRQQELQAAAAGQRRLPAGSLRCGNAGPAAPRPSAVPALSSPRQTRARGPAVARPSLSLAGECSAFKERFMECLRDSGYESGACRQRAMAYLECRMERQVYPGARRG